MQVIGRKEKATHHSKTSFMKAVFECGKIMEQKYMEKLEYQRKNLNEKGKKYNKKYHGCLAKLKQQ